MNTAVERFLQLISSGGQADGALVTSEINRFYLTGFPSDAGAILATKEQAYLLLDFRYLEAARRQIRDPLCQMVLFSSLEDTLCDLIQKHNLKNISVECDSLTLTQAANYEKLFEKAGAHSVKDRSLDVILREMRAIKTPEEIRKIKESQRITDAAFEHILPMVRPGVTEQEIALEIEFFMRRQGAQGVAFDLIVVSGANGSLCHGVPSDKRLEKGDFVTMDTGALLDGYHSDMTRTVAIGSVSDEQRRVYDTVLSAQLAALAAVKPGVSCRDVDKAARDIIEKDYPGTFGHSTGHAVGVMIHEWPNFSVRCQEPVRPGMVMTVEPGIYLEGKFGVRIEDMVAVTENGCENLTFSPKELMIL